MTNDVHENDSVVTVVNPEEDDITVELEFYDATMEGVDGVEMPDPDIDDDVDEG